MASYISLLCIIWERPKNTEGSIPVEREVEWCGQLSTLLTMEEQAPLLGIPKTETTDSF